MKQSNRSIILLFLAGSVLTVGITYAIVSTIQSEAEQTRESMETLARDSITGAAIDSAKTAGDTIFSAIEQIGKDEETPTREKAAKDKNDDGNNPSASERGVDNSSANLIQGLFNLGRETARTVDDAMQEALQLDQKTQQEIGDRLHRQIINSEPVLRDQAFEKKANSLAKLFLDKNKQTSIHFTLLESDTINAFAHIGGYVYLNSGLVKLMDDDELQFVIGHEIGHVLLGHCSKKFTYAVRASEVAGGVGEEMVSLAYNAISIGYSQEDELDADQFASERIGNPAAAIRCMEKIARASGEPINRTKKRSSKSGPQDAVEATINELDTHFRTHPPTSLRIERLEGRND